MISPETAIGLEIELPWRHMLQRVDIEAAQILSKSRGFWALDETNQARVQQGFDAVDEMYKDTVDSVFGEHIAKGYDGYREFALRPKYNYLELLPIVQNLYDEGILQDNEEYSLHVTLGNVPPVGVSGYILMASEIVYGTTPSRVTQAKSWARKGTAGINGREPNELQLGMLTGVEMRSLMLTGVGELKRALRVAQAAGAILVGKEQKDAKSVDTWHELIKVLRNVAADKGVDASVRWQNPGDDPITWQAYSDALADEAWRTQATSLIEELFET